MSTSIDSALEGLARKLIGPFAIPAKDKPAYEKILVRLLRESGLPELIAAGQALASPYAYNIDLLIFDYKQALAAFLTATDSVPPSRT